MTSTSVRLFSQEEYHCMTEAGILDPDERVELLEGQINQKETILNEEATLFMLAFPEIEVQIARLFP
ncbi:hypothetical protein [Microseira wollei]|uniref:Uncharacterized protein n=1 Tax=Microseira wollei NIES-4236 TaxID=2530354 RepID=A0AAV3XS84_9CYAN|nr:hypothetical protein [Microseira wollei]GET44205.1 protein of unknown function DUF820 [Microseira wollei NIES-4236]